MRGRIVREIFLKELRDVLRDRRSLMALFGVPLFLYPLMIYGFGMLGQSMVKKAAHATYSIAVVNASGTPKLEAILNDPSSGLQFVDSPDPMEALRKGAVSAVLEPTRDFEASAVAGRPAFIHIVVDRSKQPATGVVEGKISGVLQEYEHWVIAQRLIVHHLPPELATPLESRTEDVGSGGERMGSMLSLLLPTLLILTGLMASLSTALVATTSEREAGSMESLLVTPARKLEILIGKALLVLSASVFASTCNLVSMSLVFWRVVRTAPHEANPALDPRMLGLAVLAVLPALLFTSSLCLVIGLAARNYREATSYAQYPILACALATTIVNVLNVAATRATLATPVVNTSIVLRHILQGKFAMGEYAYATVASLFWAFAMLALAARLFNSEQLVNVEWEPLAILRRHRRGSSRKPTLDEAMLGVGILVLLVFYVGPMLTAHVDWDTWTLIVAGIGIVIMLLSRRTTGPGPLPPLT